MKTFSTASSLALLLAAALLAAPAAAATYGKGVGDSQPVKVSELVANPDKYVGKAVKIEGLVTEVCAKRGCWMTVAGDKEFQTIRFKVDDGVIVFPMDAKGLTGTVEGVVTVSTLSEADQIAQGEHMAKEKKTPFDPKTVKGPKVSFLIKGDAAEVF